jgi:flagellar hook-associated protein 3 FlgL
MSRVSENSSSASIKFALNKAKSKLEDLQLKGSTLRDINRPSDAPLDTVEGLSIKSTRSDNKQFLRNVNHAKLNLNITESSLQQLTDILVKAKEIGIAQSSDLYNPEVRGSVANEIKQMRNQALSIANKRIGQKFLFGGHKTLNTPFEPDGTYNGDKGKSTVEISKDFFVPVNLHGREIFYGDKDKPTPSIRPLESLQDDATIPTAERKIASESAPKTDDGHTSRNNIFAHLDALASGLDNDDPDLIQSLLPKLDQDIDRLIGLRTQIGSLVNSVQNSENIINTEQVDHAERYSHLMDADVAELFSNIQKQQDILQTTYKSSQGLMNQKLLDFMR